VGKIYFLIIPNSTGLVARGFTGKSKTMTVIFMSITVRNVLPHSRDKTSEKKQNKKYPSHHERKYSRVYSIVHNRRGLKQFLNLLFSLDFLSANFSEELKILTYTGVCN
jgi:hypothetical protein